MAAVFLKILNMSIAASWLILMVIVLRLLQKKVPRSIYCLLWALVGIRLVFPFSVASALSLIPSGETVSPSVLEAQTPVIHTGIAVLNQAVNPVLASSLAPEPGASVNPLQIITAAASVVWLLGLAVLLLYGAFSYIRLRWRVGSAIHLRDNLWQTENAATPFVLGFLRPRVYLPFALDEQQFSYVVAHEKAHLKRRDHWWKPLGFLLLSVYWFNPLVWLAYGLLCRDIELACDERVVKTLALSEKKAYSAALLACSVPRRLILACPLAFGEVGVKDRIKAVLNYKKPAFWVVAAAAVTCVIVAVCFLTNPPKSARQPYVSAAGSYVSQSCLYINPLSSFLPDDDDGLRYLIGEDRFAIVGRQTGETTFDTQTAGLDWQALSADEREKFFASPLFDQELLIGLVDPRMVKLSDEYYLFDMDGALWIGEYRSEDVGFWTIFSLIPEGTAGVSWAFTPTISSRYPAFKFLFDLEYTHIEAECDSGQLVGFDDQNGSGCPHGQTLSCPAGSALYWSPFPSEADQGYVMDTQIRFFIYKDGQVVYSGKIDISSSAGSDGLIAAIYKAVLTEGDGLMMLEAANADGAVLKEAGAFPVSEASVGWPSGATVANADLDHDGTRESITVSQLSAGSDIYELQVLKADGSEIWREELSTAHVGWNALFLCTLAGADYLLRYSPANFQGECNYSYDLFSIEDGQEKVRQHRSVAFDVNGENLLDVESMTALADEVNALLGYSVVLISTLDGTVMTGPFSADIFREDYDILLTGSAETLEEAAVVRTAQIYLRQQPLAVSTIINLDTPDILKVESFEARGIHLITENYEAGGPIYQVTFATIQDAILGPIVLFVDSRGTVFGTLLRD